MKMVKLGKFSKFPLRLRPFQTWQQFVDFNPPALDVFKKSKLVALCVF